MRTLAIDIGGTKLSMAVFDGDRMVRRESQSTDREGGRDWMLAQIIRIAGEWQQEAEFGSCGVGFGGPVDFAGQRVFRSTHVGGWSGFPLRDELARTLGLPVIRSEERRVGREGRSAWWDG